MKIRRPSTSLVATIAAGLVVGAVIGIWVWLLFGRDGDGSDTTEIKADNDAQFQVTPLATAVLPDPLPTAAGDFASLCVRTEEKTWSEPPPMIIDPSKSYTALLNTEKGDVTIKLLPEVAPYSVNNFVFLACAGFFDGLTFHWVVREPTPPPPATPEALPFVQSGDPYGNALADPNMGGPGYNLPSEFSDHPFRAGTVGMAGRGPDTPTSGSQFFVTLVDAPALDGRFTVIGEVTSGFDVLKRLTPRVPQEHGSPGDKLLEVTITEGD